MIVPRSPQKHYIGGLDHPNVFIDDNTRISSAQPNCGLGDCSLRFVPRKWKVFSAWISAMFLATPIIPEVNRWQPMLRRPLLVENFTELTLGTLVALHDRRDPVVVRPPEVLFVCHGVRSQHFQLFGQFLHRGEVVNVEIGPGRGNFGKVRWVFAPHNHRYDVLWLHGGEKLFRVIVLAIIVLKSQVELVVFDLLGIHSLSWCGRVLWNTKLDKAQSKWHKPIR